MSLVLPTASVTVQNGGLGVAQSGPTNVCVFIGPSSKGDLNTPLQFNRYSDAASVFGAGLMPKAAAYATRGSRARYICMRVPSVAEDAVISTVTKPVGKTVVLSGTPTRGNDVIVTFVAGGTIGITGITYKVSKDNGVTYGAVTPLLLATTIVIDGVTITLTSTETYSTGNSISFQVKPGSQKIEAQSVTRTGSSTSTMTFSGAPEDDYEVQFVVVKGGTIGTVGITFKYSLDNGNTFSPETALNTSTAIDLYDGTELSGVALTFGAGTLDAGDRAFCVTTAPSVQASDVQAALDILRASVFTWRFIHAVGDMTVTKASSIASKLDTLAGQGIYTYGIVSARDKTAGEVAVDGQPSVFYSTRLVSEFSTLATDRLGVSAGRSRVLCPLTGRLNRRPASWPTVQRLIEQTVQVDPGRKRSGALPSDVNIFNTNGSLVEIDSRVNETLHDARFITLRTYDRQPGTYITRGSLMSSGVSDFDRIAYRAVMDVAAEVFQAVGESQLENYMLTNPATGPNPGQNDVPGQSPIVGALGEADARVIDRELYNALYNAIVAPGYAVAVSVRVSREDNLFATKQLTAEVSISALAYVDTFKGTIKFVSQKVA